MDPMGMGDISILWSQRFDLFLLNCLSFLPLCFKRSSARPRIPFCNRNRWQETAKPRWSLSYRSPTASLIEALPGASSWKGWQLAACRRKFITNGFCGRSQLPCLPKKWKSSPWMFDSTMKLKQFSDIHRHFDCSLNFQQSGYLQKL